MFLFRTYLRVVSLSCSALLCWTANCVAQTVTQPEANTFHLGGAARLSYGWKDYSRNQPLQPELMRVSIDGTHDPLIYSYEYRWYRDDLHFTHHAWAGWRFNATSDLRAGIVAVPFGLLPDASQSFWLNTAYFVGLEANQDLGAVWQLRHGPHWFHVGTFVSDEYGSGRETARLTPDVTRTAAFPYRQRQHLVLRYEHTRPWAGGTLGLGASALAGRLDDMNQRTHDFQDAFALHGQLQFDHALWQLQWIHYADHVPTSGLNVAAFHSTYTIVRAADIPSLNVSYTLTPTQWVDKATFYNNLSGLRPAEHSAMTRPSIQNVVGCSLIKGHMQTYIDLISGKNLIFSGGDGVGIVSARPGWHTRLNVNIGFYF